jgi:hypothetical protein
MDAYRTEITLEGRSNCFYTAIQLLKYGILNLGNSHVCRVIHLIGGRLCSGSGDSAVKIWDHDNRVCEVKINTIGTLFRIVQVVNGRLSSGHYGGKMNI